MKTLILITLFSIGCASEEEESKPNSSCYKLSSCNVHFYGTGAVEMLCVYGYDQEGYKRTKEVHRFMSRDTLAAWSLLNPSAKECP